MNSTPTPTHDKQPRDSAFWAHTSTLKGNKVPTGALNLNVEGRQLLGPLQGFGQLWQHVLTELAARYRVTEPMQTELVCIDPKVQWSHFWNIWQNAAIRTFLYKILTPVRWTLKRISH